MILHVDMDAFYASVEIHDNPSLAGKPVVVGGSPTGRGVISAASYEARKYGIHSAMPSSKALRLCPKLIFVKSRMDHYSQISKEIREVFNRFTSLVEPLSLDEAFLDVSGSNRLFGESLSIAQQIKEAIRNETGLVASAGVAPNKYLAKVASDLEKPDGLVFVDPENVEEFLRPLSIRRIWGVGKQCAKKFDSLGVTTIGQLRHLPKDTLKRSFGVNSDHFWKLARGIDSRKVVPDRVAKSISHETTFASDIRQRDIITSWLMELTEQVARRLRRYDIRGRTVQLKIRFSDFHTITRSFSISEPSNSTRELWDIARTVLHKELDPTHRPVRLIGMGVSNLSRPETVQKTLFDEEDKSKLANLDRASDAIREKFGHAAVRSAKVIEHNVRHRPDPRVNDPKVNDPPNDKRQGG